MARAEVERELMRRIPDDELVFVLRAQDKLAAEVVEFWADRAEEEGVRSGKVAGARDLAKAMRTWPKQKLPD